ncbi:MAG: 2-amino-4-hydroxy-6-hydroxymethyldihydropteridine diphosphokinase [Gammaproteobacteria bacterium]|nr:2-amino-4-hydroxy-6-hydroxymethyldihydropteridine diphosphokinase [Gammaproteobacteria bacterium]
MPRLWLSLGSNIDRKRHILGGLRDLNTLFGDLVVSTVYESAAVGFDGAPFYNLVVGINSDQSAGELLEQFRGIEADHERIRGGGKLSSRTLDIDILTYGDQVMKIGKNEIPRDEIDRYAFVLCPLSEVAGSERHPVSGERYDALWEKFDQQSQPLTAVELVS